MEALQCCVCFCHNVTWISHKDTCVHSLCGLPPALYPFPSLCVVTEYWVELPALISNFPSTVCFIGGDVYVSVLLPWLVPPSPSPAVSASLFSVSPSVFPPCIQIHQCDSSRFHSYGLIYGICFSLSDLLHSVHQALGSSTSLDPSKWICFYGWVIQNDLLKMYQWSNVILYVRTLIILLLYFFIYRSTTVS